MSKVVAIMSMSLDGYVADRNDGVAQVFDWYVNSGDVEFHTGGAEPMTFRVSEASAEHLRGLWSELGAVLTGRRTFEVADGWGGNHAWGPAFYSPTCSGRAHRSLAPSRVCPERWAPRHFRRIFSMAFPFASSSINLSR